jgi:hypothetical protein
VPDCRERKCQHERVTEGRGGRFRPRQGLGENLAAVSWGALALNAAEREFTVDTAKDQLQTIPSFARHDWPQTIDRKWLSEVYARYNEKPYWETK